MKVIWRHRLALADIREEIVEVPPHNLHDDPLIRLLLELLFGVQ